MSARVARLTSSPSTGTLTFSPSISLLFNLAVCFGVRNGYQECGKTTDSVPRYDSNPNNAGYFKQHVNAARKIAGGRPVWITEFKPAGTNEEIKGFLDEVLPWLDASKDVHRYAYFMATTGDGMLINDTQNGLSEVGRLYHFRD